MLQDNGSSPEGQAPDAGVNKGPKRTGAVIRRYVELLTGSPATALCWRFLPEKGNTETAVVAAEKAERLKLKEAGDTDWRKFSLKRNFDGALDDIIDAMREHQKMEWGIFCVVNEGGRNGASIKKARALHIDLDNVEWRKIKWHIDPDFIVYRDDTHAHVYWRVSDLTVEQFIDASLPPSEAFAKAHAAFADAFLHAQLRLIEFYGSDPAVHDLPRVLRVPGTKHMKDHDHPHVLKLLEMREPWEIDQARRTTAELMAGLPELDLDTIQQHKSGASVGDPVLEKVLLATLAEIPSDDLRRADWRDVVGGIRATNLVGDSDGERRRAIAHAWMKTGGHPIGNFDDAEGVDQVFDGMPPKDGGLGYGSLYYLAQKHNPDFKIDPHAPRDPHDTFAPFLDRLAGQGSGSDGSNAESEHADAPKQDQEDWSRFFPPDPERAEVTVMPVPVEKYLSADNPAPSLQTVIEEWIEHRIYVALSGPGGTHKSRLLAQLLLTLRYRRPWFPRGQGTLGNVQIEHIEYLSYENKEEETRRRLQAMAKKLSLNEDEAAATMDVYECRKHRTPLMIVKENNGSAELTLTWFGKRMLSRWEKRAQAGKPMAIVLDSLFNAIDFRGNSKNSTPCAQRVIYTLDHWAEMFNALIVAPHHPSRAGMARGDTGYAVEFDNTPREVLSIRQIMRKDRTDRMLPGAPIGSGTFRLTAAKMNNLQDGRHLDLVYNEGVLYVAGGAGAAMAGVNAAAQIALEVAYGAEDATRLAVVTDAEREVIRLRHLEADKIQRHGMYKGKRLPKEHWLLRKFCQMRGGTMQGGAMPDATKKDIDDFKGALEEAVKFGILSYLSVPPGGHPDRTGKAGYSMPAHGATTTELPHDAWPGSALDGAADDVDGETPS